MAGRLEASTMALRVRDLLVSGDIDARKLAMRHLVADVAFDGRTGDAVLTLVPIASDGVVPMTGPDVRHTGTGPNPNTNAPNELGNGPVDECRRWDSNPHALADTAF